MIGMTKDKFRFEILEWVLGLDARYWMLDARY